jgi:hypothetical protein
MNLSLEPHQLVAHWVPGFVLLLLTPFIYPDWYVQIRHWLPEDPISRAFIWVVLPFVAGQLIDAFRNSLIEDALDERWPKRKVNWAFFFSGDKENLDRLRRFFFDYYVIDVNLAFAALCFTLWRLLEWMWEWPYAQWHHWHWGQWHFGQAIAGIVVISLLLRDARSLRMEIADCTNRTRST